MRGPDKLVSAAEFTSEATADEAWALLVEADIPASVVTDPMMLGGTPVTRVMVERKHLERSQALLVELVTAEADG